MANKQPAGKLLLDSAKCFEWLSPEDLDKVDCVLLTSAKNNGAIRVAHRKVLEAGSEFFARKLANLSRAHGKQSERWSNEIRLDISIEMIDIVLEHLYTGEPIPITDKLVVEAYGAAKRLGLCDAMKQVKARYFQSGGSNCLNDDTIWDVSHSVADIECLIDVFEDLKLDDTAKRQLMERVRQWATGDPRKSKTVSKIHEKLFPTQRACATTSEPSAIVENHNLEATVAVVGKSPKGHYVAISMSSMDVIWSGTFSAPRNDPVANSVVINDLLFIPSGCHVYVRSLSSNELIREIKAFHGNCIGGVRIVRGEVFFHTRHELFVLSADGTSCTEIAHVKDNLNEAYFAILKRDANELSIAIANYGKREVWTQTFRDGSTKADRQVKLQALPWNMAPIGCHRGLLYYCTVNGPPFYYAAFRNDVKVKYHEIAGNCYDIVDNQICDGVYYILYVTRDNAGVTHHVRAIDLNMDTIVFNKPVSKLGLQNALYLIRVLGKPSRSRKT